MWKGVITLHLKGHSVTEIHRRLQEESISISHQALYNLVNEFHEVMFIVVDGQPR